MVSWMLTCSVGGATVFALALATSGLASVRGTLR
jgi:hypothetical protein